MRGRFSSAASTARRRPGTTRTASRSSPGNYYVVGGNTKLYGAVHFRYRKEDFSELAFPEGGISPAWPFSYDEFEPWYSKAEQLYQTRGTADEDPTEPFHSKPYPHTPVPDEPAIAKCARG